MTTVFFAIVCIANMLLCIYFARRMREGSQRSEASTEPSDVGGEFVKNCRVCCHKNGFHNGIGCAYLGCSCQAPWTHGKRA